MRNVVLALVCLIPLPGLAAPGHDAEGCKDPPFLTRYPGSWIHECEHKDFDKREFTLRNDAVKMVEGERDYLYYWPVGDAVSRLELHRNYLAALRKAGFTVVYDDKSGSVTGKLVKGTEEMWIEVSCSDGEVRINILRSRAMEQKVDATDARGFLEALNTRGSVAVYGINFDTGKATITADSAKVLDEILKLLKENPKLELLIEGHTDDVGTLRSNLDLSKKRAAAVRDWLVKNGCDSGRLLAEGVGHRYPVAGNDTPEGKGRNRRVELVKL